MATNSFNYIAPIALSSASKYESDLHNVIDKAIRKGINYGAPFVTVDLYASNVIVNDDDEIKVSFADAIRVQIAALIADGYTVRIVDANDEYVGLQISWAVLPDDLENQIKSLMEKKA